MLKRWIGAAVAIVLLAGCATRPTDPEALAAYQANNDPLEPFNRSIFAFNQGADRYVIGPVVSGYRTVVPKSVREGVDNFSKNLKQPIYLINALLQADFKAAGQITGRFVINTVFGFFGVFDTAGANDIPFVKRDFGQTLAVWGLKDGGPYIMLPLLGPTTIRDAVGMGVDAFADPVDWALYETEPALAWGRFGLDGLVAMDNTKDLKENMQKNSTDYYATMRSMYQQNRRKEIGVLRGETEEVRESYDFDFPDDEEEE